MTYRDDITPQAQTVIDLYESAGLQRPPDPGRISAMYANSDIVVTAWDGDTLAGVARSITDWSFSCYLSDLAVHNAYQRQGIGKELIRLTTAKCGDRCMLVLLSVPTAIDYYIRLGLEPYDAAFIIRRQD